MKFDNLNIYFYEKQIKGFEIILKFNNEPCKNMMDALEKINILLKSWVCIVSFHPV